MRPVSIRNYGKSLRGSPGMKLSINIGPESVLSYIYLNRNIAQHLLDNFAKIQLLAACQVIANSQIFSDLVLSVFQY